MQEFERMLNAGESAIAASLAGAVRRKRRGERVDELAISAVGIVCFFVGIAPAFDPSPYRWLVPVQIGLPWASFAWTWYFVDREHQQRHNRYVSLFCSSWLISLAAMIPYGYVSFVSRPSAVVAACVAGLAISAVVTMPALVSRKSSGISVFAMATVLAFYSYAALCQLNCVLDRSPIVVHESSVLAKGYVYLGPNTLRIGPFGQDAGPAVVGVSPKVFHTAQPGDTICVLRRSGALHMPWFTVQACSWSGEPVELGSAGGILRGLQSLSARSSRK